MSDEQDFTDDLDEFEDDLDTVIMTDEEGNETTFFVVDEVDHEGSKYLLLLEESLADDEEADAVIFKQVGDNDEEFVYEPPTDAEFEAIAKILSGRLDDYEITF